MGVEPTTNGLKGRTSPPRDGANSAANKPFPVGAGVQQQGDAAIVQQRFAPASIAPEIQAVAPLFDLARTVLGDASSGEVRPSPRLGFIMVTLVGLAKMLAAGDLPGARVALASLHELLGEGTTQELTERLFEPANGRGQP